MKPFEDRTIPLKDIKREYLLDRPEILMRAQFNRIPTREEVTGLVPDQGRDTARFELPGNKKFREDSFLRVRDDEQIKYISPSTTQETLKIALNSSRSKLTESLLSLAVAEPVAFRENNELLAAEENIAHRLNIAPNWDVDSVEHEKYRNYTEVKASELIFRGNVKGVASYMGKKLDEAKAENLPYFEPTGNVQIDEMNRRNLKRGILPIPNFAGDNNPEITPDDLTQIDQMAQGLARHIEVSTTAKQPFDTAAKIVDSRLAALPTNADDFFQNAGFPTVESRTATAYSRYLKLLSKRGTTTQVLDIFDEMRQRGLPMSGTTTLAVLGALQLRNATEDDNRRMVREMMLNKPNLDKTTTYFRAPEWMGVIEVLPKSKTPYGVPEGFVSCAPNISNYGEKHVRGEFTPSVEYAFYLFERAKENGMVPTKHVMTQLMKVCGEHRQFERAFVVLEEYKRYAEGQVIDPRLAVNAKEIALAKPHRDAKLQGWDVDQQMAVVLMQACMSSGKTRLVEETFHRFWESGLQPNAPMYNQVIISCTRGGYVEKAFKYFEQLQHFGHTPSIVTYSSLIRACSAPDRPEFYPRAFEVFHECIAAGFRPDKQLFYDLLTVTVEQSDVHNLVTVFRLMTRDFPHLIDVGMYSLVVTGLGKSMFNEKLPGFGGYVLTRTGRTLFGQTITGDAREDTKITSSKKIKLTREDRLAMVDAIYSEVALRCENQDRTGTQGGEQFRITSHFLQAVIGAYSNAASGILQWDRHERKEGREDPLLRLTSTHISQLIERTWGKVVTLQKQHPHVFKLDNSVYRSLFDMYGAADRMDDAVYHLLYLTRGLNVRIAKTTYTNLLDWCEKNAHHGPAMVIMDEMRKNRMALSNKYVGFFEAKERQMNTPMVPNSFPSMAPHPEERELQFQQPRRDKKTGKMVNHPMDWDGSYKDF